MKRNPDSSRPRVRAGRWAAALLALGGSWGAAAAPPDAPAVDLSGSTVTTGLSAPSESHSPPVLASALRSQPIDALAPLPADTDASGSAVAPAPSARWVSSAELSGQAYRWSLSRGAVDIGMRLDAPASATTRPFDSRIDAQAPYSTPFPAISLGLRRGSAERDSAGNLLARAMASSREAGYASKVGVEWKPAESQVKFLREGLGLRLDGTDRMTVRLRKGVLGIYMQRKF
jgi:hypothetical protein